MKELRTRSAFKKDLKKVSEYPNFPQELLKEYIDKLLNGKKLPEAARDHKMSKSSPRKYQGLRDFHLTPDICVIYKLENSAITLYRIGKHNNLDLTEEEIISSENSRRESRRY